MPSAALLANLRGRGIDPTEVRPKSKLGGILHRGGVADSPDLRRILELPEYRWQDDAELEQVRVYLEGILGKPKHLPCVRRCGHVERQKDCAECARASDACVCRGDGEMHLRPAQVAALQAIHDVGGMLGPIRVGGGKCLGLGTEVLLFDGTIKAVEEVVVGDQLMGPDSAPRKVLGTTRGAGPLYRIVPVKGDPWVCNDVHVLTLVDSVSGKISDVPLDQYLARSLHWRKEQKLFIPTGVEYVDRTPPEVDPYFMGLWLGDGSHTHKLVAITTQDPEIVAACRTEADRWGLVVCKRDSRGTRCPTYFLAQPGGSHGMRKRDPRGGRTPNPLLEILRKEAPDRVPPDMLLGSRQVRLQTLAGLLDADGYLHHGYFEITQKSKALSLDIAQLARSLGFRVTHKLKTIGTGPYAGRSYHRLSILGDVDHIPTRLARKQAPPRIQKKDALRTGFAVEPIGIGEYAGFELDGDGRFLLGDFTVTHNTAISFLAGPVLGAERVLLLIPAKLRDKTKRDFARLGKHWRGPDRIHIINYELLSRDRGVEELNAFKPDLIIADEAHKLKNTGAACTKRLKRYLKEHPGTRYIDMSGTTTKRSIKEYAHRYHWAVGEALAAVPKKYDELADWADAIDEKPSSIGRVLPGALLRFANEEEISTIAKDPRKATAIKITRQAFSRRLLTAPGVVGTEDQFDGAMSLSITGREILLGDRVVDAFRGLRESWELPDGHPIETPVELWRHARELVQGFYYLWDPLPPMAWLVARREWSTMVREILKRYRDIDSPMVAAREVDAGRIPWAAPALAAWREIRPTFEPHTVAEWIDDACLQFAAQWAKDHRGLIWVSEVAFGERLSKETGLPYYQQKGRCKGKHIEEEKNTCIASVWSCNEGCNLQYAFNDNLVVSCPPGGGIWEQMIGRTHRDGQDADEVTFDVLMGCYEQWSVFRQARRDAEYMERTMQQSQKLNYADVEIMDEQVIEDRHRDGDPLWSKENARFFLDREAYSDDELRVSAMRPDERASARRGQG